MDELKKERLISAGVDLSGALERFMDNEKLYENFLRKFVTGSNFEELENAFAQNDWKQALAVSHNLKGVTGSLGFTQLYELICSQVAMLYRDENSSAAALMEKIMPEYRRLLEIAKEIV